MTARRSNMVSFSPDRVEQAIEFSGFKKKDLFLEREQVPGDGQMLARTYRRRKKARTIKPGNLEWLAKKLKVATGYLRGDFDWPLKELPNEDYINAYKEVFLNPANCPYRGCYDLQSSIDYGEYERQLVEIHGVDHSDFVKLGAVDRLSLLECIDGAIVRKLGRMFPECTRIDFYDVCRGYDLDDVIEILDEYLGYSEPDADFVETDDQEDPFVVKYLMERVERKTWGYKYPLNVVVEGGEATSWQAEAVFRLESNWDSVDGSADCLISYLKSNAVELEDDGCDDLYWIVRPKALEASSSCSRESRLVSLVCDCRLKGFHELRLSFLNEELSDIQLA